MLFVARPCGMPLRTATRDTLIGSFQEKMFFTGHVTWESETHRFRCLNFEIHLNTTDPTVFISCLMFDIEYFSATSLKMLASQNAI